MVDGVCLAVFCADGGVHVSNKNRVMKVVWREKSRVVLGTESVGTSRSW